MNIAMENVCRTFMVKFKGSCKAEPFAKGAETTKLLPCWFYIFFDGFKWNKDGGVSLGKKPGQ